LFPLIKPIFSHHSILRDHPRDLSQNFFWQNLEKPFPILLPCIELITFCLASWADALHKSRFRSPIDICCQSSGNLINCNHAFARLFQPIINIMPPTLKPLSHQDNCRFMSTEAYKQPAIACIMTCLTAALLLPATADTALRIDAEVVKTEPILSCPFRITYPDGPDLVFAFHATKKFSATQNIDPNRCKLTGGLLLEKSKLETLGCGSGNKPFLVLIGSINTRQCDGSNFCHTLSDSPASSGISTSALLELANLK
jgi:hypothetical protein